MSRTRNLLVSKSQQSFVNYNCITVTPAVTKVRYLDENPDVYRVDDQSVTKEQSLKVALFFCFFLAICECIPRTPNCIKASHVLLIPSH